MVIAIVIGVFSISFYFMRIVVTSIVKGHDESDKSKIISALGVNNEASKDGGCTHVATHTFTLREVAAAAKNFRADCLLGEGWSGIVYRGRLESTNQVIKMSVLLIGKKEEAEDKMFELGTEIALCG
ncbi:probable serine/threonine-protein kinase PBL7 [Tanacetum coccineum]